MTQADDEFLLAKELNNTLESYAYEMRSNIEAGGSLEQYIDPALKEALVKDIGDVIEWLYGDGANA